jgi:hypothetical protein
MGCNVEYLKLLTTNIGLLWSQKRAIKLELKVPRFGGIRGYRVTNRIHEQNITNRRKGQCSSSFG